MSTLATQNNGQESGFPVLHTIHIASIIRYAYIIWGRDKKVLDMNEERDRLLAECRDRSYKLRELSWVL